MIMEQKVSPLPSASDTVENPAPGARAKAGDLDILRKTVEDAAAVTSGLWISYLFLSFYIAVAAAAVTHTDLLLENPVKLPFLGIELPLLAFFLVAPVLFLIAHSYTLVHFAMLGRKSARFHDALYAQFPTARTAPITEEQDRQNQLAREAIRRQLPSNIFVQFLAGPKDIRAGALGELLKFIAWVTLVFGPLALLLELQIQFLPYHDLVATWAHRGALVVDIGLIWWLWKKIVGDVRDFRLAALRGILRELAFIVRYPFHHLQRLFAQRTRASALRPPDAPAGAELGWRWRRSGISTVFGFVLSIAVIWFSCAVAIMPGDWLGVVGSGYLYERLFNGPIDPNSHRRASTWSNTLILPRFNIYDVLKVDDPKKVAWRKYLLSVRGRDLTGAVFDEAFMERTDARNASLQGASFFFSSLQGSALSDAHLEGANLSTANLEGALLIRAKLSGAILAQTRLQGANLTSASLRGADLAGARLEGTNLRSADLRGANLAGARVRGSALADTQLQGTNFDKAKVEAVSFDRALIWRAVFRGVSFANLSGDPRWPPQDRGNARWGPNAYSELRKQVDLISDPDRRELALKRVEILDCRTTGAEITSCDQSAQPPDNVRAWQKQIKDATLAPDQYSKALAEVYLDLICSGDSDALAVLRSLASMGIPQAGGDARPLGILETRGEAKGLVENITNPKCLVSGLLTDADKALLLEVGKIAPTLAATDANVQQSTSSK
jgi:uncharacterized protein YjbI with pentapeptide repeats